MLRALRKGGRWQLLWIPQKGECRCERVKLKWGGVGWSKTNAWGGGFALSSPGIQQVLNDCLTWKAQRNQGPGALPPPGRPPRDGAASSPPAGPSPTPPLQDVLADGGAVVEVVAADGDAVPENEGASVLLFVEAEALPEILVGLEAAAQLHGCPLSPRQGLALQSIPGVRGHTVRAYRLPSVQYAFEPGPTWVAGTEAPEEP